MGSYLLDLFYYGTTVTDHETISGSFTNTAFTIPAIGAYTGHSDIGTLSFSRTVNGTSYPLTYTIHADNTAEFIVGHASSVTGTTTYYDLFYDGVTSSTSPLSSSYLYKYAGYLGLELDTTSDNVLLAFNETSMEDLSSEAMYINPLTKSVHFAEISDIYDGAYSYNAGYLSSDGSISFKVLDYESSFFYDSTASGQLYGTNAQGLGAHESSIAYTDYGLTGQTASKTTDGVFTYYYDTKTAIAYSGNPTFNGYFTYIDSETAHTHYGSTFSLDINRDTGAISSSIATGVGVSVTLSGTASALSSYYIDEDTFGVLASSGTDGTNSLIANSGFLISLPDSYNGGTYAKLDDESSWGYWTAKFGAGTSTVSTESVDPRSAWVAGIETATSYINSTQDGTFTGHVLGAVTNGSAVYPILFDANNNVSLTFSFGSGTGTFTGSMSFKDSNAQTWSTSVASGITSTTGFTSDATGTGGLSSSETISVSGAIAGKYFGTGSVKSVGGKFYFNTATQAASGVFKATK